MLAQIGRKVADAERPRRGRDWRTLLDRCAGLPDVELIVVVGDRELQQRIVDQRRRRQGRKAMNQRGQGDALGRQDRGPFALPLAQRDQVLNGFTLRRIELQAMAQHLFGRLVLIGSLQRARALIERGGLVRHCRSGHGAQACQGSRPFGERKPHAAEPLVNAAQVDVRRHEVRIECDRLLQTLPCWFELLGIG